MKAIKVRLTAAAAAMMIAAGTLAVPAFAVQGQSAAAGTASSARSTRETDSQTMNSVFLLPDSDTYYISESDVSWMDDNELMLARNEFYARRGRKFATKSIQDYFNRQGWYTGTVNPDDFTSEMFNRYEQANVDFIVAYEKKRKEVRAQKQKKHSKGTAITGDNPTAGDNSSQYGELVSIYQDALADNWSEEDIAYAGMNDLIGDISGPEELGYTYRDLDGDGSSELLIGPTDPQLYGEGAVFEIYTIEDGIPVEIASSGEGCIYYICEDNTIRREVTENDGLWEIDYFDLQQGDLVCKDMLVMDESVDAEEPWFVVDNTGELEIDTDEDIAVAEEEFRNEYEAISFEDASALRASYVAGPIDYVPFE